MEVRTAYAATDFEWDQCQRVCATDLEAANVRLMRRHALQRFGPAMEQAGSDKTADGAGGLSSTEADEQR